MKAVAVPTYLVLAPGGPSTVKLLLRRLIIHRTMMEVAALAFLTVQICLTLSPRIQGCPFVSITSSHMQNLTQNGLDLHE
jgi:hypothetical protein